MDSAMNRVVRWWTAPIPLARVAVFRTVVYLFLLYDIFVLVNDVVPHGYAAELYRPLFIGRVLPLPEPSPPLVHALQVVLVVGALVAATGRPRLAGWVVAVCYLEWLIIGMSFGKVDHDHLALLVAMWVLPTVGRARFGDLTPSEAGGWAFRCVQVATIATYVGSAFAKWSRNGAPFAWGQCRLHLGDHSARHRVHRLDPRIPMATAHQPVDATDRGIPLPRRAVSAGEGSAPRRRILPELPPGDVPQPRHPLPADGDLLAGVLPVGS